MNSQGMRITSADRAVALMGKLDVRAMAHELRQKVRDEVFALAGIDPLGFNLVADAKLFGTLALGAKRHSSFAERLDPVLDIQGEKYTYRYQPFPQLIHPLCQGDFQHLIQILDPCAQNLKGQQFAIGLICIIIIALHYPIPLK